MNRALYLINKDDSGTEYVIAPSAKEAIEIYARHYPQGTVYSLVRVWNEPLQ